MKLKKVIDNNYGDYQHEDEQGCFQGKCVRYYWNGRKISKEEYYKDYNLHGISTWYKENGEVDRKEYWWNDVEISRKEYFLNVFKELEK